MKTIEINGKPLAMGSDPFVVAEVGINHNGDLELAKAQVRAARESGADAVKFGMFKAEEFVGDPTLTYTYESQGRMVTEPMLDMFKRTEFAPDQWREIRRYCDEVGITFFSTAQNRSDFDFLLELGVELVKIGSDDLTNTPMLESFTRSGLPIVFSSGMANLADVHMALEALGAFDGYPVVLLHCTSEYPTPSGHVNLRKMQTLKGAFPGVPIGYSDHTEGCLAAPLAVAYGACYLEKHFTMSRTLPGPDHRFSADPDRLKAWVAAIREAHAMLGSPLVRPTEAEKEMQVLARRSIVALADIAQGEAMTHANIGLRRPGNGLPPSMFNNVLGRKAARPVSAGALIGIGDLS
jgi:sialic acid synthase SpsE